jgi:hypothetical protein
VRVQVGAIGLDEVAERALVAVARQGDEFSRLRR